MREDWACHEAAAAFADYYLCEVAADEGGLQFSARWRGGYDRLQPGSACGSAMAWLGLRTLDGSRAPWARTARQRLM